MSAQPDAAVLERPPRAKPDSNVRPEARQKITDGYQGKARQYRNRSCYKIPAADKARQHQRVQAEDEQNDPKNHSVECRIETGTVLSHWIHS